MVVFTAENYQEQLKIVDKLESLGYKVEATNALNIFSATIVGEGFDGVEREYVYYFGFDYDTKKWEGLPGSERIQVTINYLIYL